MRFALLFFTLVFLTPACAKKHRRGAEGSGLDEVKLPIGGQGGEGTEGGQGGELSIAGQGGDPIVVTGGSGGELNGDQGGSGGDLAFGGLAFGGSGGDLIVGGQGGEPNVGGTGGEDPEAPQIIQSDVLENACLDVAVDYAACGGGKLNLLNFTPVEGEEDHWMYRGCVELSDAFDGTCGGWLSQEFVFRWVAPSAGVYTFGLRGEYKERKVRTYEDNAGNTGIDRTEVYSDYADKPVTMYVRNQCDRREPEIDCQANRIETGTLGRSLTLELNADDEIYVVVDDWSQTQSESHASDEAELHIYRADAQVAPRPIDNRIYADIQSYDGINGADPNHYAIFGGIVRDDNADLKKVRLRFFDVDGNRISPIGGKDEIEFLLTYPDRDQFTQFRTTKALDQIANQITRIEVLFEDWQGNESAAWQSFQVGDSAWAVDEQPLNDGEECDPFLISNTCSVNSQCKYNNESGQYLCRREIQVSDQNIRAFKHGNRIVFQGDFSGRLGGAYLEVHRNFNAGMEPANDIYFSKLFLTPHIVHEPINGFQKWQHQVVQWIDDSNPDVESLNYFVNDSSGVRELGFANRFDQLVQEMQERMDGEACDPKRFANVCADGFRCVEVGESHECQVANAPVLESARLLGARNGVVDLIEVRGTDVDRDAAMIRYRFSGQAGYDFLLEPQDVRQGFDRVTYDGDQFVAQLLFPEILLEDGFSDSVSVEVVDAAGLVSDTLTVCSRCDHQGEEFFVGMVQQGEECTHYYNNLNGGCANGTRCWDAGGDGVSRCEDINDIEILEVTGWYNADQNRLLVESTVREPLGDLREIWVWVGFEGTPGRRVIYQGGEFTQRREGDNVIFEKVLTEEEFEDRGVPERVSVEARGFDQMTTNPPALEVALVATPEVQDIANEVCDPEQLRNRCPEGTACLPNNADADAGPRCQP